MMKQKRIFYFCPDFAPPSAGTLRIYRHVSHLQRLGYETAIIHNKRGFALSWHDFKVPLLWIEDEPAFLDRDVLVIPEAMTSVMKFTKNFTSTQVVIALNWAYIHTNIPFGENWKDYNITAVITPSPCIKDFIEWSMGIETTLIQNYVNTEKFTFNPATKLNRISYLSNKNSAGETLHSIFQSNAHKNRFFEWFHLNDLSYDDYARRINETKIFLATSHDEGIPTSIFEAMASGCLVIGYAGIGGNDYLIGEGDAQNCILIDNGDLPGLGKTLEYVLSQFETNDNSFHKIIENGMATARKFGDFEEEGRSLENFFDNL